MKKQRSKEARDKKRKKEGFFPVIFVPCFLFLCFCCGGCSRPVAQAINQVCFGDQCIKVAVVQKEEELHRGLQFRKSLDPDSGMLFVFLQSQRQSFWMKNTLIPLDMIWMDHARRIVHIARDVPPCKEDSCPIYTPPKEALYVLEVNAGHAAALGLQLNDQAEFKRSNERN